MITAKSTSTIVSEPIPAGTYLARCYSMVHLGTHDDEYQGRAKKTNKVRITWELPTELKVFNPDKGEQPMVVSKEFTLSMAEKANLRAFLTSWRGKPFTAEEASSFDITKLLGVPCQLSIIHEPGKKDPSRIYERISSISSVMKGVTCPPQINPTFVFSLETFDPNAFAALPDWLKDIVRDSDEYKELSAPAEEPQVAQSAPEASIVDDSDDLPF
jgi:hypothetical protein